MEKTFSSQLHEISISYKLTTAYSWNRLFDLENSKDRFIDYLIQMYHYVKFSCPLMELVRDKLNDKYESVREYLKIHIQEEKGHDNWLLDDLERLGYSPNQVKNSLPNRETIALIGSQFYIINQLNPVGYLGYIYYLESNPPTLESLQKLSENLNIPQKALFTLREHAKADPEHIMSLNRLLDSDIFDVNDQKIITYNLQMTIENLSDLVLALAFNN